MSVGNATVLKNVTDDNAWVKRRVADRVLRAEVLGEIAEGRILGPAT